MAIYPIVKGQKFEPKNVIPPRASLSDPAARPLTLISKDDDLINFSEDQPSTVDKTAETRTLEHKPAGPKPPLDPSHESTVEIQELLAATGERKKEGPLIDFHNDLKKDLPVGGPCRSNTDDSHDEDEFVDARD